MCDYQNQKLALLVFKVHMAIMVNRPEDGLALLEQDDMKPEHVNPAKILTTVKSLADKLCSNYSS